MDSTTVVIKGALYFDGDLILRPHFSGSFYMVDCTEFKPKEQILSEYSEADAKDILEQEPITYRGVEYFKCEYSPFNVAEDWVLLSDISEVEFFDNETDF
jgi:hypothetical protein